MSPMTSAKHEAILVEVARVDGLPEEDKPRIRRGFIFRRSLRPKQQRKWDKKNTVATVFDKKDNNVKKLVTLETQ